MVDQSGTPGLTIIIPAYNEERRIGPTLQAYVDHFGADYGGRWELLAILNGCIDQTEAVVEGFRHRFPQVRSIVYPQPLGKGGAVLEGLRQARGNRVAFVDADNMVGPQETAKLVKALDLSDIAIGWRRTQDGQQPVLRRVASWLVRFWTRRFLGLRYHDTQCGAKALTQDAVAALLPHLEERGWALDLDILVSAESLGLQVEEIPVAWSHVRQGSKLRLFRAGWEFLRATWRLRRKRGHP